MNLIPDLVFSLILTVTTVSSYHPGQYGEFTLRITHFDNPSGRLANGQCCGGEPTPDGCPLDDECPIALLVLLRPPMGGAKWTEFNYAPVRTGIVGRGRSIALNFTAVIGIENYSWQKDFQMKIAAFLVAEDDDLNELRLNNTDKLVASILIEERLTPAQGMTSVRRAPPAGTASSNAGDDEEEEASVHWAAQIRCVNDYHGDKCQVSCRDTDSMFGHFTCDYHGSKICMPGWRQPNSFKPCTTIACSEGCVESNAYCNEPGGCECKPGWKGQNCSECVKASGCMRGDCRDQPDQCVCQPDWAGALCNIDRNYCTRYQPCMHGGACIADVALRRNYTCICKPGYQGNNCQSYQPCAREPCKNGGTCQVVEGGYLCECTMQHEGRNCERPRCRCWNGGECVAGSCACATGFTGNHCEVLLEGHDPPTTTINNEVLKPVVASTSDPDDVIGVKAVVKSGGGGEGGSASEMMSSGKVMTIVIVTTILVALAVAASYVAYKRRQRDSDSATATSAEETTALA